MTAGGDLTWSCARFGDLSTEQLYALLTLRQRVFVVEQTCPYLDCDGLDAPAWHLWATRAGSDAPQAYARILPPGTRYPQASIGRVVTAPESRRTGLGKELMRQALVAAERRLGPGPIRISAQLYLQRFYEELGFVRQGDVYDEDGIPHISMLRR